MNSLIFKDTPRAMAVECSDDELRVSLTDGCRGVDGGDRFRVSGTGGERRLPAKPKISF